MVPVASQRRRIRGPGVLRLAALLLPLGACFVDPGRHGQSDPGSASNGDSGATTATQTPTSGDPTSTGTDLPTGPGETGELSGTATGDPTADATTAPTAGPTTDTNPTNPTGQTTDTATTGPNPPVCGNGIVEGAEGCDDGPENGSAFCNADCTAPTCSDFIQNLGESDVDCGGSCAPCGLCQGCNDDADCDGTCLGGKCSRTDLLDISYATNCGITTDLWVTSPVVPGGTYRVVAEGGGGSVNGEDAGFGWLAECVGFDLQEMSTDFVHLNPQEAYAALPANQLLLDFTGGELRCGLYDQFCADNTGGVSLSFTLQCPP